MRKLIIITTIGAILAIGGLPEISAMLTNFGLVGFARELRTEFLTGTALAIILVLLILVPPHVFVAVLLQLPTRLCNVCNQRIDRTARYCPHCGSRVT